MPRAQRFALTTQAVKCINGSMTQIQTPSQTHQGWNRTCGRRERHTLPTIQHVSRCSYRHTQPCISDEAAHETDRTIALGVKQLDPAERVRQKASDGRS